MTKRPAEQGGARVVRLEWKGLDSPKPSLTCRRRQDFLCPHLRGGAVYAAFIAHLRIGSEAHS